MKLKNFLFLLLLVQHTCFAQFPKYVNNFLEIGVGGKGMAMGGAVVAGIDDGTAGYWNPAGLASNYNSRQFILMHSEYFGGLAKYDFAALAMRLNHQNALGFSFVRFGVDNIPNTLNLIDNTGNIQYDRIRSFSAADYAGIFSYGRQTLNESFKFGISVKVIHRVVGKFANSWGFGFDGGLQKHVKSWHFGLVLRDMTTTYNTWMIDNSELEKAYTLTGNDLPLNSVEITKPSFVPGIGKDIQIKGLLSLKIEANAVITTDGQRNGISKWKNAAIDPRAGMELNYGDKFYLRAGGANVQYRIADDNQLEKQAFFQPSMGAGVTLKNITIDYGISSIGDFSNTTFSNIISLKLDFNKIR